MIIPTSVLADSNPAASYLLGAGGLIFVLLYFVASLVVFLIGIWISYSVIWRAVRRGMKEFHKGNPGAPTS